mgnify:CR=1 FL=1
MLWLVAIPLVGILLLAAPWFYSIWIGRSVTVSPSISVSVAVYTLLLMLANIYMYLINGTGKVRIQLIIYLTFAIISYPIMNFSCARWAAQHPAHPFEISPGVGVGECRPERVEDEHSYHVDAVEVFVGYVVFGHRVRPDVA